MRRVFHDLHAHLVVAEAAVVVTAEAAAIGQPFDLILLDFVKIAIKNQKKKESHNVMPKLLLETCISS